MMLYLFMCAIYDPYLYLLYYMWLTYHVLPLIQIFIYLGVGNPGDIITTRPMLAYKTLLMPGHAVYATPENMEKYKVDEDKGKQDVEYSSPYVKKVINLQGKQSK